MGCEKNKTVTHSEILSSWRKKKIFYSFYWIKDLTQNYIPEELSNLTFNK